MNDPKAALAGRLSVLSAIFFKQGRLRPFLRVLVYILAVITALEVLAAVYLALSSVFGYQPAKLDLLVLEVFLTATVVVGLAFFLRHSLDRRSVLSLGLALKGTWLRLFAFGALFGAGMQTIVFLIVRLFGHVQVLGFGKPTDDLKLIPAAAMIFVAAALSEEVSLRGYILQNLWEEWGFIPAAIVTSLGFAALHFRNPHAQEQLWMETAALVSFALWACLSVLWTKSLWLALGCHAAWNLFEGPIYGFRVSGLDMPTRTAMVTSTGGPQWFTGGNFGPEAGLSSIVAISIGTLVLWLLFARGAFRRADDAREAYARRRD